MTLFIIILSITTGLVYGFLQIQPDMIDKRYLFYISRAFHICSSIVFVRAGTWLIIEKGLGKSGNRIPSELLRLVVAGLLYTICTILLLKFSFNMNITALLTTSALLTAIIGFAMQATLGNFFSGLSLQIEHIFYLGDTIRINKMLGRIEALSWRSLSLRTPEGSLVVIPNSKISSADVEVFAEDKPQLMFIKIPAPVAVPPQRVRKIIKSVIAYTPYVAREKPIIISVDSFEATEGIVIYKAGCFCSKYSLRFMMTATIKERIWYAFLRNKVDLIEHQEFARPGYLASKQCSKNISVPYLLSTKEYLVLVSSCYLFQNLCKEEKIWIADNTERLLYTQGEPILFEDDFKDSMFLISTGRVKSEYSAGLAEHWNIVPAQAEQNETENLWNSEALKEISEQLAVCMGPIAIYLVRDAAGKTFDPYYLYQYLAQEIDNSADRQLFLSKAPKYPVRNFNPGDPIGELRLFTGKTSPLVNYQALGQVELLTVQPQVIKELVLRKPGLVWNFSSLLAKHLADEPEAETVFPKGINQKNIMESIKRFYADKFNFII